MVRQRRVLELVESSELPPVPEEHREILEPLTSQQLLSCYRQTKRDLRKHIRKHHPHLDAEPTVVDRALEGMLETFVDPVKHAQVMRIAERMSDRAEATERDTSQEALRWAVSSAALDYCAHASGHGTSDESPNAYLRRLADRIH